MLELRPKKKSQMTEENWGTFRPDKASAAQTALEAGTSERKIFAHYRALVSDDAATLWFSGAPKAHQEPTS